MEVWIGLYLVSAVLSWAMVGWLRQRFSQQWLDIPNERSSHKQPTPRGGGLGFIVAFGVSSVLAAAIGVVPWSHLAFWGVLLPLAAIGLADDKWTISAKIRYLVQLSAASLALFFYPAFPQPWLTAWGSGGQAIAIALTVVGMTAIVNFYNFMDGLDGLVAGCAAVQLIFLGIYFQEPLPGLLAAALVGFLYWNWSPAKIFMGDVGSTVLGAFVAIALLGCGGSTAEAWSALAIALPLVGDAIFTLCVRLGRGENIFQAHRCHIFQRLQQFGWSHQRVTLTYLAATVVIAIAVGWGGAMGAGLSAGSAVVVLAIAHATLPLPQTLPPSTKLSI